MSVRIAMRAVPFVAAALSSPLPLVASPFTVTLMNYIGIGAIVALGLVLLTGFGGLTSFGQAAFVGIVLTPRPGSLPCWGGRR